MFFSKRDKQEIKIKNLEEEIQKLKEEVSYFEEIASLSSGESIVVLDRNSQIVFKNKLQFIHLETFNRRETWSSK